MLRECPRCEELTLVWDPGDRCDNCGVVLNYEWEDESEEAE